MGIFSKTKKDELVLLFDIGSSSVGGALFYMGENGVPKIIYSIREPVILEKEVHLDRLLFLTIEALKTVANNICMKGLGAPNRIFCTLASPWYASQTRVIKYNEDKPFIFTTKLADELIQKEMILFEEEHVKDYNLTGNKVTSIELKNMKISLNGYDTLSPFNQKVENVEITIFASVAEEQILNRIEDNILRHFRCENIRFSSFLLSSFAVVRNTFVNQDNFLLVNIGGEVTDISMIKKDVLRESISFPMGHNFIIRGVANELSIDLGEAQSLISTYKDGHMSYNASLNSGAVIENLKNDWLKNFQEFLSHLTNDVSIPSTIFITVAHNLAQFFSEIIKNEQFNQYILTESKFRVIFLGVEALHGIAIVAENVDRDQYMIIESIYINHFLK